MAYLPSDNPASLVAWFRMGVGVTETLGLVSSWADQSGNGRDLLQAVALNQPTYSAGVITFDGLAQYMKCAGFTWNQPEQVSILGKQITWNGAAFDTIVDGNTQAVMAFFQFSSTPEVDLFSGGSVVAGNTDWTLNTFNAVTCLFKGTGSSIKVGSNAETSGNTGASNASGFTLGAGGDGLSRYANIGVKEIILRNVDDATIRAADQQYLIDLQNTVTPVAEFSGTPLSGNAPLSVQFTDLSTNTPTSWAWTFGDGDVSTSQNPSHHYLAAGTYTVGLTATNSAGSNLNTKTNYISVSSAPTPSGTTPSGVPGKAKRHERVIRLADIKSREDTAEFLKKQLNLRHPDSAFETVPDRNAEEKARRALAKQERRDKESRLKAEREAAKFAKSSAQLEAEQREAVQIQNDNMKILIMLGSAV